MISARYVFSKDRRWLIKRHEILEVSVEEKKITHVKLKAVIMTTGPVTACWAT
jgi:hypothetical protein